MFLAFNWHRGGSRFDQSTRQLEARPMGFRASQAWQSSLHKCGSETRARPIGPSRHHEHRAFMLGITLRCNVSHWLARNHKEDDEGKSDEPLLFVLKYSGTPIITS